MREGRMIGSRVRLAAAIGGAITILVLIVLLFAIDSKLDLRTMERDAFRTQAKAEQKAHRQTVANYRAASTAAQAAANRNVERVAAEQAAITKGTIDDYQARLAAVDARYERVRAQLAARSDFRSTNLAPVSIASDATCRAYGGGDCDALLAKLAIAERQAENLVGLRGWVRYQAKIKVIAEPVPK